MSRNCYRAKWLFLRTEVAAGTTDRLTRFRIGAECIFVSYWPIPEMTAGGRGVPLLGCTGRA